LAFFDQEGRHENVMEGQPELVIYCYKDVVRLCYKIILQSHSVVKKEQIYVDAINGNIVTHRNLIKTTDAVGTANTKYSGVQPITTDFTGSSYRLRESGRNTRTMNAQNNVSTSGSVDFTNTTNTWTSTANDDDAAYSLHFGLEAARDYYFSAFSRNSFNGTG